MKYITTFVITTVALASTAWADSAKFDAAMAPVLTEYLEVHKALAADSEKGVPETAKKLEAFAKKLDAGTVAGEHAAHYKDLPGAITTAARALAAAKGLDAQREAFKGLSKPMAMWATMSKPAGVYVVFCSMAKASWLQTDKAIANPYMGSKMLTCGEITGGLAEAKPTDTGDMRSQPMDMGHMKGKMH